MKKKIALALTTIMALSNGVSLFAATVPAGGSVAGDGEVAYIDSEIYSVVLPTTATLDFNVDPLGLLGVEDGKTADIADLEKGKIVGASTLSILNKSSVAVSVDVELNASGDANIVTDKADVEDGSTCNAMFLALPAKQAMKAQGDELGSDYVANDAGIIFDDSSTVSVKFTFPAAKYNVANDGGTYSYEIDATGGVESVGGGSGLQIAGYVNPNADWTDYSDTSTAATKFMKVNAAYTIAKATDAEIEAADDSSVYAISAINGAIGWEAYEATSSNVAEFVNGQTYDFDTTNGVAGKISASTAVTSAYFTVGSNKKALTVNSDYTYENGVFTLLPNMQYAATLAGKGNFSMTVAYTTADGTGTITMPIKF